MASNKKIAQKFSKQLQDRADALMYSVMYDVTKDGLNNILVNAPFLPNYKNNLEVRGSSFQENSFAIVLPEEFAKLPMVDPVVLRFQSKKKPRAILDTLTVAFQPFTQYTLPVTPDENVIRILYKKVTHNEFVKVYQKNLSDWKRIVETLKSAGINPREIDSVPNVNVYEDLSDRIIKLEEEKPHWGKMIDELGSGELVRNLDLKKFFDSKDNSWKNKVKSDDTFSRSDEESWEEFQKKIIG